MMSPTQIFRYPSLGVYITSFYYLLCLSQLSLVRFYLLQIFAYFKNEIAQRNAFVNTRFKYLSIFLLKIAFIYISRACLWIFKQNKMNYSE